MVISSGSVTGGSVGVSVGTSVGASVGGSVGAGVTSSTVVSAGVSLPTQAQRVRANRPTKTKKNSFFIVGGLLSGDGEAYRERRYPMAFSAHCMGVSPMEG